MCCCEAYYKQSPSLSKKLVSKEHQQNISTTFLFTIQKLIIFDNIWEDAEGTLVSPTSQKRNILFFQHNHGAAASVFFIMQYSNLFWCNLVWEVHWTKLILSGFFCSTVRFLQSIVQQISYFFTISIQNVHPHFPLEIALKYRCIYHYKMYNAV